MKKEYKTSEKLNLKVKNLSLEENIEKWLKWLLLSAGAFLLDFIILIGIDNIFLLENTCQGIYFPSQAVTFLKGD